jgi:hypothetical protein
MADMQVRVVVNQNVTETVPKDFATGRGADQQAPEPMKKQ